MYSLPVTINIAWNDNLFRYLFLLGQNLLSHLQHRRTDELIVFDGYAYTFCLSFYSKEYLQYIFANSFHPRNRLFIYIAMDKPINIHTKHLVRPVPPLNIF